MAENPYKKVVLEAAREFEIPACLIHALIEIESAWRLDAQSHCGAAGLMQLMPLTFVSMAQKLRLEKPDIWNPVHNIRCGSYYLRRQYDKFLIVKDRHERWKFALASYNCGAGYVQLAMRLAEIRHNNFCRSWNVTKKFLSHEYCFINQKQRDGSVVTKRPYADKVIDYLEKVIEAWNKCKFYGVYT